MQREEENNEENKTCLIIVFGVPASGKSTFCRQLQKKIFP